MTALTVKDLHVEFTTSAGVISAVRGVNFEIQDREAVAIVGESGCGKTQTALALMGLLANNGTARGWITLDGKTNLLDLNRKELDRLRGQDIAMVFQDPMAALHPSMRIGKQLIEGIVSHQRTSQRTARAHAIAMLQKVGIPNPHRCMEAYPHQLSGGLCQRVMIVSALMCNPRIIIADEPTTALDVTIQAQILDLFTQLREELDVALVLITHDIAIIARTCTRMIVMYAGQIVESGPVAELLANPQHPYTLGLLQATPRPETETDQELYTIPGQPPDPLALPAGCAFRPRCQYALAQCHQSPELITTHSNGRQRACWVSPAKITTVPITVTLPEQATP